MKSVWDNRGTTLIEIMTVVAILGLLAVILGFSFQGWMAKYKVDDQTKRLYADISDARARAIQKKRMTFVTLAPKRYRTFEDTNTAPDGNGTLDPADAVVTDERTDYSIDWVTPPPPVTQFSFDREGLASTTGTIHLDSTLSPNYDCITIQLTRLRIGRFDGTSCQEQ